MFSTKSIALGISVLSAILTIYFYPSFKTSRFEVAMGEVSNQPLNSFFNVTPDSIFVDSSANGLNDGSSWPNAFNNLQSAFAVAGPCDTILVARGTYYPSAISRDSSFNIPDSSVVFGGFPSGGGTLAERDWVCNKTILSGDIGIPGVIADNSFHVVTTFNVDSVTLVDGFCITGGNADSTFDNQYGGGWFNKAIGDISSPTIRNSVITNNRALYPTLPTSGNYGGGGMANYVEMGGTANPTLINCIISANTARRGGGMFNYGFGGNSSPKLFNCIISGNSAIDYGGGMYNDGEGDGEGIGGNSSPILTNCVFNGNSAGIQGGGMFNAGCCSGASFPQVTNCIIWNNTAPTGPAIYNDVATPTLSYNIVQGGANINGAATGGNNNILVGVTNKSNTDPLFLFAPPGSAAPTAAGDFHVKYNSPAIDMGLTIANPTLYDLDGNDRVQGASIDIGAYEFGSPDCTLYSAGILYVDSSATGANNGTDWDSAFVDLQDALLVAYFCDIDTILVAQGTYYPDKPDTVYICGVIDTIYPLDRTISFNIPDSVVVMGGFPSGGDTTRDWLCNVTTLCGDIDRDNLISGNSYHVVYTLNVSPQTVVDGFYISGGLADSTVGNYARGGGWFNDGNGNNTNPNNPSNRSNPTIRNNTFILNFATKGGGLYNDGRNDGEASPAISNSCFVMNSATEDGGAMLNAANSNGNSSPTIDSSLFESNTAGFGGAMANISEMSPGIINISINHSIFRGNSALTRGGAIFSNDNSSDIDLEIINTLITGNSAQHGGGIYNNKSDNEILNSVLAGNNASIDGGAIFNTDTTIVNIMNSIIWNNSSTFNDNTTPPAAGFYNPNISFSIIQSQSPSNFNDLGSNKIGVDPKFYYSPPFTSAPTSDGDFHIQPSSPAIDMGTIGPPDDLDGNPRPYNVIWDIGAYEFIGPDCTLYPPGTILYVDVNATGANNGLNWDSAFTDLQDALLITKYCPNVDTVLVAQGTYYPSILDTITRPDLWTCDGLDNIYLGLDSTVSFDVSDSTVLLGGYDASTGIRDLCNKTTLCGDINQDGTLAGNSIHVVTTFGVSDATIVDGFCIRDGNAVNFDAFGDGTFRNSGGGWLNLALPIFADGIIGTTSNPQIINCVFIDNNAFVGAGLANIASLNCVTNPTIGNCSFFQDSAILGGGIANIGIDGESSPIITNSKIQGNTGLAAGGILNLGGSLFNNFIVNGQTRLNFSTNDPTHMIEGLQKSGLIENFTRLQEIIQSNTSSGVQSTVIGYGESSPIITNSLITGNAAVAGGGIINFVITNGPVPGGESATFIINTNVAGNSALFVGGGILNGELNIGGGTNPQGGLIIPTIINSILWNNIALDGPDIYNYFDQLDDGITYHHNISASDYLTLNNNCTDCVDTTLNNNKFQTDPQFRAAPPGSAAATTAGDFHVKYTSPAIDMGDNMANLTAFDLDSNARVQNAIIDIGPYEFVTPDCSLYASGVIYVDTSATGANNGTNWDSAFTELQDALFVAYFCDIDSIYVAQGVYYPGRPDTLFESCSVGVVDTIYLPDRTATFIISDSTVVLGGFPNGGGSLEDRDWVCNKTILCGELQQDGDSSNNSFHVVTTINVDSLTIVDGFCIIGGNADSSAYPYNSGGGWLNDAGGPPGGVSNPTIRNTIFTGNNAVFGGGMFNQGDSGGVASPILINVIFSDNTAAQDGGAMYNNGLAGTSSPRITNGIISGNSAAYGGGVYNNGADGGVSAPVFINLALSGNAAASQGGGIYNNNANPILVNSITWNNSTAFDGIGTSITTISYSISQTGATYTDGGNNKPDGTDPLFVNAPSFTAAPTAAGDFHVSTGSDAINMGENPSLSNTYPTDLDGMPRIMDGIIDIGPYEKLLNCDTDTLFVLLDGTIPSLPVDSLLLDTIPEGCTLFVNGIAYTDTDSIPFTCDQIFDSNLDLLLVCGCDTIDGCTKIVVLIDSFEKNLVCNDLVNISLGNGCLHVVTTDDVLENIMGCRTALYDVELSYPLGTHKFPPANDQLDESHIGYTMVYSVYETLTGNSCWGYLKVEDKLPPQLECSDTTIPCYVLPNLPLLVPNADDCFEGKVELISDEWFDYGCDSVLSGLVIRTIQGTDRWGNFDRCERTIYIEKTVLDSVVCPELIELPCEIRYRIGDPTKTLKTAITVDQSKVTPDYLLSLQKSIWKFNDGSTSWILDPSIRVVPEIEGQNIWPGAGGICKINSLYKDTRLDVCGAGFKIYREWTIVDWCTQRDTTCVQYIKVSDTEAPELLGGLSILEYDASTHDCVAAVTIPALIPGTHFRDCNMVDQTYSIEYDDPAHPGKIIVLTGTLPSSKLFLPVGEYKVVITLVDKCQNRTITSRIVHVHDITPPIPVCDEFTQVTLDPVTCWAKVKAKDLDNGSRDNCCDVLHFAAAHMDSITYWRNYWTDTLEARCGTAAFLHDKEFYDFQIERWINAYVFKDEIKFDECGTSQVVLRVYEACGVPIYDPHVWPCTEHQWFWYNTDQRFRIEHNWNFFHASGPKNCNYRYSIQCLEAHQTRGRTLCQFTGNVPKAGGLCYAQYDGAVEDIYEGCDSDFYFPQSNSSEALAPGNRCSNRFYNDCMVNVLVDDKQAPVVAELEDVVVYCDKAPDYAVEPDCKGEGREVFISWPGLLIDKKGVVHGYYGGSDFLGIHSDNDHGTAEPCGYDNAHHWAPIYCRSWLYLDSFDSAGKIDPKQYFETLVLFDKTRAARTLLAKEFSITDNCRLDDATMTVSDEGSLNGCGEGWIQRTWTIKDKCGNIVTAKQKVVVKHRSDFEVIFPADKVVECDFLNSTDPRDAGEPIISDDECEQVGVQYKDEVFTVEDSACYKIVRTWTLIDWCIYNPNAQFHYSDVIVDDRLRADTGNRSCVYRHLKDNNDGYMKYIQVIKVIDKVAPAVATRDTTICIYAEDCKSALVRIPFNATDNCTATSELSYKVEVDLNATNSVFTNRTYVKSSIDQTTQSNQVEFIFSPSVAGKHVVHVIVKDNCGNEDTSSYRFELTDCKKPTPYCYNGVATVIMPSTGRITVWAKDLDAGSLDNCTLAANLKFSFSSNVNESSREFSCADIPDGKSKTIPVDIWVTDSAGNQDHCSTYILLQDNSGNICPDVAGLSVTIAGTIKTETNEPVEHVTVNIYGGALQMNYQTGIRGTYHFEGLPSKSNYSLKSTRDDQPMNGVSTLDLVLIQKHILGIELLDSPYKILAADVDNDKQITAIDLVELRKLILATYQDLPNNESWRFIPKSTTFNDPQNPWHVSEVLEMKEVTTDHRSEDFIGLKVGDVNATAAPHSLMGVEVRGNETGLLFEVNDHSFNRGEIVRVDFRSPNFRGISGWQGTLNVSDQLSVVNSQVEPGSLNLTNQNVGMRYAKDGKITMSWNTNAKSGLDFDDQQVLFTLVFKAQEKGKLSEVLRIGSQHTIAESYQGRGELGNLSIRFVQNGNEIVAKSELYQNYPNPFDQRTVIGINLAGQGKGILKVYDATGRTIKSVEREWTKGYHEVWFDRKEIGASGVLYYRFESGFFNASKKMIILD